MRNKVLSLTPEHLELLERCVSVQREMEKDDYFLGFNADSVNCWPIELKTLNTRGLLTKSKYSSNRRTLWEVTDIDQVESILNQLELNHINVMQDDALQIPNDIFAPIIGHENIKWTILKSLNADRPVHVLLLGSPSTAKSLFLQELSRIAGSRYALGGSTSKVGLVEFLLENKPKILLMDELDKLNMVDTSALLSLMETGKVTRLKHSMTETEVMKTWVFGAANSERRMPPELKSRFMRFDLREYTPEEFAQVAKEVLVSREGIDATLANYISVCLAYRSKDIRDAVRIGRLAKTPDEVDKIIKAVNIGD